MNADAGPYVSIAKVGDASSAGLAVALLRSAGIPARMHGEGLGPYRMTVGEMAVTEIWVPEPDEDDAREILAGSDLETYPVEPTHTGALGDPAALPMRLLAALVGSILVWSVVRWVMRVF